MWCAVLVAGAAPQATRGTFRWAPVPSKLAVQVMQQHVPLLYPVSSDTLIQAVSFDIS